MHLLSPIEKSLSPGFTVRRLLPASARRSVGPFVFFDHFGPVTLPPEQNIDVRPHPHIGLATVTYLFEGAMVHRDSLGSVQRIEPGALNWMTAGRGIVHSERRPRDSAGPSRLHGLQLWVALPVTQEETAPSFVHTPRSALPEVHQDGVTVRVLVGTEEASGRQSPVDAASPTLYLDVVLAPGARWTLGSGALERAVYCVEGNLTLGGLPLPDAHLTVVEPGAVEIGSEAGARFVVIGGAPLDGPRRMWWNFVSSRPERIRAAAADWAADRFDRVPDDDERIPLPTTPFPD